MKYFFATMLISLTPFSSCNAFKPIVVRLHPIESTGQQLGTVSYLLQNIPADSAQIKLASQLHLHSFVVSEFDHVHYKAQLSEASALNPDAKTIFLTGFRNDSIIIIPDLNNNNQLDDDKIIAIDKNILKSQSIRNLEKLPLVQIKNLQVLYNSRKYVFSRKLFIFPDTIRTGELTLRIISNEQEQGKFKYKRKTYYVRVRHVLSGQIISEPTTVNIRIDKIKNIETSIHNVDEMYHLNDTIRIGKIIFRVERAASLLHKIIIKPVDM